MQASTRVFISATSGDLGSVRQLVKEALLSMECLPIEQTNFPPDYRTVEEMLREKIAGCQAVIHIVGRRYGADPDPQQLPDGTPRRSFTQLEYDLARQLDKQVYVFLCPEDFPFDDCDPEPEDLQQLQQQHRESVVADPHLRNEVTSREDVSVRVREMRVELDELRKQMKKGTRSVLTGIAALIVVLGGVAYGLTQLGGDVEDVGQDVTEVGENVDKVGQDVELLESSIQTASQQTIDEIRKLYEDPDVLTGKLKSHIRQRADEQIAEASEEKADWQAIEKIEKSRDSALDRVEDMVATIRKGLAGKPNEVFAEAARILAAQGVEQAIAYLEAKQPAILDQVDRINDRQTEDEARKRDLLQPLLLQADLHESSLDYDKALQLYETVAKKAPQWSRARRELGRLLKDLAQFDKAEPQLQAALELADDDEQRAYAANDLGLLYLDQARYAEAEPLLKEFLKFAEQQATEAEQRVAGVEQREPPANVEVLSDTAQAGRSVPSTPAYLGVALNSLALLLHDTNRLAEAEPLMRRALAIDEQSFGAEHPSVAIDLNNLAQLLKATNRLAEAESLMRRALAIREQSYGPEHPRVAIALNNLAVLLQDTDRLAEAEPLMRRAMAIDEQSYGPEHPRVAACLSNLAVLLNATDRLAEAEPLMRRTLAIDEQSYGPEHPDVALRLNNLAALLQDTNRLAEAEPLSRRALEIYVLFRPATGFEHPRLRAALGNYFGILVALELSEAEIIQQFQAAKAVEGPLESVLPEVKRLLGPARPVTDVLAVLDAQYRQDKRPGVYFLASDEPIAPHLDQLLGPARSTEEVLQALDKQYKAEGRPAVWFLPLDEPISPHLDELLGPVEAEEPADPSVESTTEAKKRAAKPI